MPATGEKNQSNSQSIHSQILNQRFVFFLNTFTNKKSEFELHLNRRGKNQIWFPAFFELSLSKALALTSHFSTYLAALSGWLGWLLAAVNCSHLWRTKICAYENKIIVPNAHINFPYQDSNMFLL